MKQRMDLFINEKNNTINTLKYLEKLAVKNFESNENFNKNRRKCLKINKKIISLNLLNLNYSLRINNIKILSLVFFLQNKLFLILYLKSY